MRNLSNNLLSQLYFQESDDPFLMLVTLTHSSFGVLYFVNNMEQITSRGNVYLPFPMKMTLPTDDGESLREVTMEFDNVSLELIEEMRTVTDYIDVTIEMVLASAPDDVEIELGELKIKDVSYNQSEVRARLFMDDFLNTEMTGEKYTPSNFPDIFN